MSLKRAFQALLGGAAFVAAMLLGAPANAAAEAPTVTLNSATYTQTYGTGATVTATITAPTNSSTGATIVFWSAVTGTGSSSVGSGTNYGSCTTTAVTANSSRCSITLSTTLAYQAGTRNIYAVNGAIGGGNGVVIGSSAASTLTVNKKEIRYTTTSPSAITYGAAVPTYAYTTDTGFGFVGADTFATVPTCDAKDAATGLISYAAGRDVGNYTVTCTGGTVGANYNLTTTTSTAASPLTVNKRAATPTAASFTLTYGDAVPTWTYTFTAGMGKFSADTLAGSCTGQYVQFSSLPGATLTTTCTFDPAAVENRNYTITPVAGTVTLNKKTITVSPNSYTVTYGDASPIAADGYTATAFPVGSNDGFLTGPNCSTTYTTTTAVAASPVSYQCAATLDTTKYTLVANSGTITINRKALEIVANSYSVTFGDASPVLLRGYTLTTGKALINSDSFTTAPSCVSAYTTSTSVSLSGIAVTCSGAVQNNYSISYVAGAITIAKRALTVNANAKSVTYGNTAPSLDYTALGFVNANSFTTNPTCVARDTNSNSYSITTPVSASPLTITCSGGVQSNYEISYNTASLTVERRSVSVTANSYSLTYGAATPNLSASNGYTQSGLTNSDAFVTLPTCVTSYTNATRVSASPVSVSCSLADAGNNYTVSYNAGAITIARATVTLTADAKTRTYGEAAPTYTYVSSAFVSNANNDGYLTGPTCSSAYTSSSNVGTYTISCAATVSNDYTLINNTALVTVNKKALTVTATSYTVEYGDPTPAYATTQVGFVNSDTFTTAPSCSSTYTQTTAANSNLPITCSGAVQNNYLISYVNGSVTVTLKNLTVTANNATVTYGSNLAAFSFTTTAFANGEYFDVNPTCSTTNYSNVAGSRTQAGASGIYTRCTGGSLVNYNIIRVDGTVTVLKREIVVTAKSDAVVYGSSLNVDTSTPSSTTGIVDEFGWELGGNPTCSTTYYRGMAVSASPVAVSCTATPGSNYTVRFVAGSVSIAKYDVTMTPDAKSVTYGSALPSFTYTDTGFAVFLDDSTGQIVVGDYTSAPVCTSTYARYDNVGSGSFAITCAVTASANYNLISQTATLTVNRKALTVAAVAATRTYGDAVPTYTYTAAALESRDSFTTVPNCSSSYTPTTAAGSILTISCSGAVQDNYTISYTTAALTVAVRQLYITSSASITYGDPVPTLTVQVTGLQNGESLTSQGSCSVPTYSQGSPATSYPVSCSGQGASANYSINYTAGNVVVAKKLVTVTADAKSVTYGDALPTFTFASTAFYADETFGSSSGLSVPTCSPNYSRYGNIGTYTITCSGSASSTNYTASYVTASLTVSALRLTVTASTPAAITYGSNAPASYTYQTVAFVNGDTFTTNPICTSTYVRGASVGSYDINCSGGVRANYTFSYVKAVLVVNQKALALGVRNISITYGSDLPLPEITTDGFILGDQFTVAPTCASADFDANELANTYANVGTYTLTCTGAVQSNYSITSTPGSITVTPYAVTVTANNETVTYSDVAPTYSYRTSGFLKSNVWVTEPTCTSIYTRTTSVGTVATSCSLGDAGSNYTLSYATGVLTVNPKPLTIAAKSTTVTYADTPVYDYTLTGLVNSDVFATAPTCRYTGWSATTPVGSNYTITCSGAVQSNYSISYETALLTVTARTLTVKADDIVVTYGDTSPNYTVTLSNLRNSDIFTTAPVCRSDYTSTSSLDSGPYLITCGSAVMPNYVIEYLTGYVTVGGRTVTVTYSLTLKYGAAIPDSYAPQITGLVNGNAFSVAPICTSSYSVTSPVATYATSCSGGTLSGNYTIQYVPGLITVQKRELTIRANNVSLTYGDNKPDTYAYTVVGLQNGENLTKAPLCTSTYTSITSAGANPSINCSGAIASSNYDLGAGSYTSGTVTVAKHYLRITANPAFAIYGSAARTHTFNVAGFVNGELFNTGAPTCSSGYTPTTPVGRYVIRCSGGVLNNYVNTYVDAYLDVYAKKLTVNALTTTVIYGDSLPNLSYTATGWVNNDNFTVNPTCFSFYTVTTPVGVYDNYTLCKGGQQSNYDIRYVTGTITVVARKLTVVATNLSTTYGTVPSYRFTANGFANGDTFADAPTCTSIYGEAGYRDVGSYEITCSGGSSTNYWLKYTDGVLTVSAKQLVVSAADMTISYGTSNPVYTYQATGFVYGDTFSQRPNCSSIYTSRSAVGPYVISCSGGRAANYWMTYVYGSLNVIPRPLEIVVQSYNLTYGDERPALNYQVSNLANGDQLQSEPTCSTIYTKYSDATEDGYYITCSGAEQTNYSITYIPGKINVAKYAITITPDAKSVTYGDDVPTYTWTVGNLINGDQWITEPSCSSNYQYKSAQGAWTISCAIDAGNNYSITKNTANLTVAKKNLTITPVDRTYTYGDTPTAYTYTTAGFVAGDTFQTNPTCTSTYRNTGVNSHVLANGATYPITCAGARQSNYNITALTGAVTVLKKALRVTAQPKSVVYGQAAPAYNYETTGFINSDEFTTEPTCTSDYSVTTSVGDVAIECAGAVQSDYEISYTPSTISIAKRQLIVTALPEVITYGAAVPQYRYSVDNFQNGETFATAGLTAPTCKATDNATGLSTYAARSAAGQYTIACSAANGGANYDIVLYRTASMTVNKKAAQVIGGTYNITFGDAAPAYGIGTITGLVDGDSLNTSGVVCSAPSFYRYAPVTSSVETYKVTCSGASNDNYVITYPSGAVLVAKKTVTLTGRAKMPAGKLQIIYGDTAMPTYELANDPSGFVNGDTWASTTGTAKPVCGTSYNSSDPNNRNAGTYPVLCNTPVLDNYVVVNNPQNLVVQPKSIYLRSSVVNLTTPYNTSLNQQFYYYGDQLQYKGISTGWISGESSFGGEIDFTCSTAPIDEAQPYIGEFRVACSVSAQDRATWEAAHPNYKLRDPVDASTYIVEPRPIIVTPTAVAVSAGNTATYDYTVNGDFVGTDGFLSGPVCTSSYDPTLGSASRGTFAITCDASVDVNFYLLEFGTANLVAKSGAKSLSTITVLGSNVISSLTKTTDWYENKLGSFTLNLGTIPAFATSTVTISKAAATASARCTASAANVTGSGANWTVTTGQECDKYELNITITAENAEVQTYKVTIINLLPTYNSDYSLTTGTTYKVMNSSGSVVPGNYPTTGGSVSITSTDITAKLTMTNNGTVQPLSSGKLFCKNNFVATIELTGFKPGSNIALWIRWSNGTTNQLTPTVVWDNTGKATVTVSFGTVGVPLGTQGTLQLSTYDNANSRVRTIGWGVTN